MNNASAALSATKLSLMENSTKKTKILTVSNTTTNCSDIPVQNAIKPLLTELQSLLSINTGTEITSLALNVTKLSLMESSSKMKDNLTAKNTTIKEEEQFVESATNQLMECVSLLLKRNGIKPVSPVPNVMMSSLAKSCSLKAKSIAQNAQTLYKSTTFLCQKKK